MEETTGVTSDPSTDTGSQPATVVEEVAEAPQAQKPPKGFVPYQALEEERSKRKEAEEKLANISVPSEEPDDVYSDEGKLLKGEIKGLNEKLHAIERKEARREAESEFPVLKERKDDFNAFLEDEENKRLSLNKAARLFLAEQNLLAPEPPERKGLEKPTSGGAAPPEPKLTPDEITDLMKTDWRKYEKLLRSGQL